MMKSKICCILPVAPAELPFGENEEDERFLKLKENLIAAIRRLAGERGITAFSTDLSRGVSLLCAELLLGMEEESRPRAEVSIPYETQAELWTEDLRDRYYRAAELCDTVTMFSCSYTPVCEWENTRRMIGEADTVLAVWDGSQTGATAKWVDHAVKCGCEVLIVAP